MTATHPIQLLWVSGDLPWYARAAIESFARRGHEVVLYTYEPPRDAPPGCRLADAGEILHADNIFGYKSGIVKGYLSGFANWFRYELLLRKGGWWADADMICLAPFDPGPADHLFASVWEPDAPRYVNNNVIFVGRPGSELMAACARRCRERGADIRHAETGPVLLHQMVQQFGMGGLVTPPSAYNPVQYRDIDLFFRSPSRVRLMAASRVLRGLRPVRLGRRSKGLHLYSALLPKDAPQLMRERPDCLLSRVVRRHAPGSLPA